MSLRRHRNHWLALAAERAGVVPADSVDIEPTVSLAKAWSQVATASSKDDRQLAATIAQLYGLKVADLRDVHPNALRLVPERVARKHQVVPLRETERQLVLATSNPTDLNAEEDIGFASGRRPRFEVAPPAAIATALDEHYAPDDAVAQLLRGVGDGGDVEVVEREVAQSDAVETTGPVVKLANLILESAVLQRASDIHLEPGRNGGIVRMRIDGVMRQFMRLPLPALLRVVSRIKIMGKLDITDHLRPQDGRATIHVGDNNYDLRLSTVPTRDGEKAVIRILNPNAAVSLEQLEMNPRELKRLRRALNNRDGIVIVTGPTGSGKTTTLYAALQELASGEVNVMTVEDPVEYDLQGITQIQVETKQGMTFASALRALLRQDPDIILVGEVRDQETASIAVQAAQTGHMVLATLHTNDAVGAVTRLLDLGIDAPVLAESLRGLLAQRLVRRLCSNCKEPYASTPESDEDKRLRANYGVTPAMRAVGCKACGKTGYRGRAPVVETVLVGPKLQELIAARAPFPELRRAATEEGWVPFHDTARSFVAEGITSLDELERALGEKADKTDKADKASDKEAATPDPATSDAPHVLVVDDDLLQRTLARDILEESGFRVTDASNGKEALAKLDSLTPDLVVMDYFMPEMTGEEVLKRIRATVTTVGLPVMMLTSQTDVDTEVRLIELGADDYLHKPIEPTRFLARVKATLRRAAG